MSEDEMQGGEKKSWFSLNKFLVIYLILLILIPIVFNLVFSIIDCTNGNCKPVAESTLGLIFANDHKAWEMSRRINENNYLIVHKLEPKYDYKEIILFRSQLIQSLMILMLVFILLLLGFYKLFSMITDASWKAVIYAFFVALILICFTETLYVLIMEKQWIVPLHGLGIIFQKIFYNAGYFSHMMDYVNMTTLV